jgi:RNA polymerase sigma-70 factor (ECF subfamily)
LADPVRNAKTDEWYEEAAANYGAAFERVARAYEADPDRRQDLLQEIHLALWRSLESFAQRCSLRTWVHRVAHNVAASHVVHQRTYVESVPIQEERELAVGRSMALDRLLQLIQRLKPVDRPVILLYLEGMDPHRSARSPGFPRRMWR